MPRRKTTDANHKEICAEFRKAGFSVIDLSQVGKSVPDILVAKWDKNILVEIKTPKGKLDPGQIKFMEEWKGISRVVRTVEDVIELDRYLYEHKRLEWTKQ